MKHHPLRESARILWAITANDLVAALKNKNVLMTVVMALLMMAVWRFQPYLSGGSGPQNLLIYDAGRSVLVPLLENSAVVKVRTCPSEEKLKSLLADSDLPEIGLMIPAGFDQALEAGQAAQLPGYVMNWVSPAEAAAQKQLVETEIYQRASWPVEVQIDGNIVYAGPDSHGLPVTIGLSLLYVILMTALPMLPHLFLEEKLARTLDALLVSPASAGQIVAGKALTGLFYCLLCAMVVLAVYWQAIVHWWLIVLSILCGSLLMVAIGLLLGLRVENRGQMSLILSLAIFPLMIPIVIPLMAELFPAVVVQISSIIPTMALFTLFRLAAVGELPWETVLPSLVWVAAWAGGLFALVVWQVRRLDRQDEAPAAPHSAAPGRTPLAQFLAGLASKAREKIATSFPVPAPARSSAEAGVSVPPSGWQVIGLIAVKDIREAVRNRLFVSILLGVAVMGSFNTFLPLLLQTQEKPLFVVYDEGRSTILRGLAGREDFRLRICATRADMENQMASGLGLAVGLILPADFDQQAGGGQEIILAGYISHTTDPQKARQWANFFETQLGQASWSTVRIRLSDNRLYPALDWSGQPLLIALVLVIIIYTLGATLVPLLFIEEREAHTLEALLVSPVGFVQVVAGKALAGATYCLLAAAIFIGLNHSLFVHWDVTMLAVLLTSLFAVSVGLLVGMVSHNPANARLWGSLSLLIWIALTALARVDVPGWPPFLKEAFAWQPGSTAVNLFQLSMAGEAPAAVLWANAGALLAAALVMYGLVIWRISRVNR